MRQGGQTVEADGVGSFDLGLAVAGHEPEDGPPAIVWARGRPRWVAPRRLGGRGPRRALLWRPNSAVGVGAAALLEPAALVGRLGTPLSAAPRSGLASHLERLLDVAGLRLAGVAIAPHGRPRVHATFEANGRIVCFAKVSAEAEALEKEYAVLDALRDERSEELAPPRPVALTRWQGLTVLALEPIRPRGLGRRAFGADEVAALARIAALGPALRPVLGSGDGLVPVHGDFVAANTGRARAGYAVWDWETVRLGRPLHDFFHWHVQALAARHRGRLDDVVELARSPRGPLEELRRRLGLRREDCAAALREYLGTRHRRAPDSVRVKDLLAHGLAQLGA